MSRTSVALTGAALVAGGGAVVIANQDDGPDNLGAVIDYGLVEGAGASLIAAGAILLIAAAIRPGTWSRPAEPRR